MASRLALVIGNSVYRDTRLARLRAPEIDIGDLADVLMDREIGGFNQVETLINRAYFQVRRGISEFFANRKRDDLLVLYFTGHGVLDDQGDLYLAVKDTDSQFLRATAISSSFVKGEMDNSRSQSQVLILDCCHSGAFTRGTKGIPGTTVSTKLAFESQGSGRVIMAASDSTQYAWEGDQIIGEVENSLFTHFLVQGLKTGEADKNHDGRITVDELYDYVYDQVVEQTPKQTPGKWAFKERGEIVFAANPKVSDEILPAVGTGADTIAELEAAEKEAELEQRLAVLYRKGLSAYWLRDWKAAAKNFQAVIEIRSDYADTTEKLAESQQQLQLVTAYTQAQEAIQQEDWRQATEVLGEITTLDPEYLDAQEMLTYAKQKKELTDLYSQSRLLFQGEDWQAVIHVFQRIHSIDPEFPDPENLLKKAEHYADDTRHQKQLESLYLQGLQAMDQGRWANAQKLFEQVQALNPSYEATQELLHRIAEEFDQPPAAPLDKHETPAPSREQVDQIPVFQESTVSNEVDTVLSPADDRDLPLIERFWKSFRPLLWIYRPSKEVITQIANSPYANIPAGFIWIWIFSAVGILLTALIVDDLPLMEFFKLCTYLSLPTAFLSFIITGSMHLIIKKSNSKRSFSSFFYASAGFSAPLYFFSSFLAVFSLTALGEVPWWFLSDKYSYLSERFILAIISLYAGIFSLPINALTNLAMAILHGETPFPFLLYGFLQLIILTSAVVISIFAIRRLYRASLWRSVAAVLVPILILNLILFSLLLIPEILLSM